jgi:hypothetical protein
MSTDTATAVCVGAHGKESRATGCFSVSVDGCEESALHELATLVAQGCAERRWNCSDVTVSLDCALFMQHSIHSEFKDSKKIAATVRFDTEEALATDASDVAIAFEKTSISDSGSDLTVFTAKKEVLSEVLNALASNGIDPVAIEPDVHCLSGFVSEKLSKDDSVTEGTVYAMLSGRNGYLVIPPAGENLDGELAATVRTFLIGDTQNRPRVLQREVLMTTAVAKGGAMQRLAVLDTKGEVDPGAPGLGEWLGVEVSAIDISRIAGENLDGTDPVEFALACGAALDSYDKYHEVNFRDDFMPYQGGKLRMQNALKYFSVSLTILLFAVGLYFQMQLLKSSKYGRRVQKRLATQYLAVMGQDLPDDGTSVRSKLNNEIRRLRAQKNPMSNPNSDTSLSSKLVLILDAVNQTARQANLTIETITVSPKSMSITGSASNKTNTLQFEKALKSTGLGNVAGNYSAKAGRDHFSLSITPRK